MNIDIFIYIYMYVLLLTFEVAVSLASPTSSAFVRESVLVRSHGAAHRAGSALGCRPS